MDFLRNMFPEHSERELCEILGLTPTTSIDELDVQTAIEMILASLAHEFDLESESEWSVETDGSGPECILGGIFPHVPRSIVSKVLLDVGGSVEVAAERLSLHGADAANLDSERNLVHMSGSVDGRDQDSTTIVAMFPSLSHSDARNLLKEHSGLHNTIEFLTGGLPQGQVRKSKSGRRTRAATGPPNVAYSKIVQIHNEEQYQLPKKMVFRNTTNLNSAILQDHDPPNKEHKLPELSAHEIQNLGAEYCRSMAKEHADKRGRAFQMAAAEFKRGSLTGRGSAQYYSDIGHAHTVLITRWNARAAQCVALKNGEFHKNDPFVLDLHGLTRAEALISLSERLQTHFTPTPGSKTLPPPLKVITGVGVHSGKHKAIILPAVLGVLKRDGWRHEYEDNVGFILVKGKSI
ncbi:hypothetical protein HDU78_006642 [Chytriomyces hyalinus]|nr:hypothetical protein HDU78_006642 [Chytriomyces hyalinus]